MLKLTWKTTTLPNMLFFWKGAKKEVYRKCDISHLRYSKAKNKIKQRPQAPQISFSKHRESKKPQERKTASAICVLPFRGRGQGRVRGGLLQWQVNASSILFI